MHNIGLLVSNPADRSLLCELLRQAGYHPEIVQPGSVTRARLGAHSAFIVDERNARHHNELLHTLKADAASLFLPLLILLPQNAEYERWLQAGFDDVLRFPLTKAELLARLRVFIHLREQSEQTYHALQIKEEFLATVSHELRTPLTAMLGWIKMIQSGKLEPEKFAYGLEVIERNARSQAQLIEDILDISRISRGTLRVEKQRVDLAAVIAAVIDTVRPLIEAQHLQLIVQLDEPHAYVRGDVHRLQQVVWNLLSNSIKFTPTGGSIQLQLRADKDYAELTVCDNGEGISAEFIPYIFERFRQGDGTITRRHSGLGLGLAIVRQLVQLHGGTIEVASAGKGCGTTFTLRLPLINNHSQEQTGAHKPSTEPAGDQQTDQEEMAAHLQGLRALLVDDDPSTIEMLSFVLNYYGMEVKSCLSAGEALELLAGWQPDLLISDIAMPGEDGISFIKKVRALSPRQAQLPAIALTARVSPEDRIRVLTAGFHMFVPKPLEPEELIYVVSTLMERSRLC